MIEHGTVRGWHQGCKTRVGCPAVIPCRTVYIRYQGDLDFRRMLDCGVPLEGIVAADEAAVAAELEAEREKVLAGRRTVYATRSPVKVRSTSTRDRWTDADTVRLLELHAAGGSVASTADAMGKSRSTIRRYAERVGVRFPDGRGAARRWVPGGKSGKVRKPWTPADDATLAELKALGYTDERIGEAMGRAPEVVGKRRRRLGVPRIHQATVAERAS